MNSRKPNTSRGSRDESALRHDLLGPRKMRCLILSIGQ